MIVVLSPLARWSSTAAMGKATDFCPVGITTRAGTVAAEVLLLNSAIVMGKALALEMETTPVVAGDGAASLTASSVNFSDNAGTLASVTAMDLVPEVNPLAAAVTLTLTVPSIW